MLSLTDHDALAGDREAVAHIIAQRNTAIMDRDRYAAQRDDARRVNRNGQIAIADMNERMNEYLPTKVHKTDVRAWLTAIAGALEGFNAA